MTSQSSCIRLQPEMSNFQMVMGDDVVLRRQVAPRLCAK